MPSSPPPALPDVATTEAAWRSRVTSAERGGDFLSAHDHALQALELHPEVAWFRHRAVLALARTGATTLARAMFVQLGLARLADEDSRALGARLEKDDALVGGPADRSARLRRAADAYAAIAADTGGTYPGINAATLYRLSGDVDRSLTLARRVLERCLASGQDPGGGAADYYALATRAEAAILLGDHALAAASLGEAAALHGGDYGAVATTYRQLSLLCQHTGCPPETLAPISPPRVIHFCGHIIAAPGTSGRFPADHEGAVAAAIASHLAARNVGFGFGSLAAGADILFAEALLARGAELHVILPFDEDDFPAVSVAPSGEGWLRRFDRCLRAAKSVTMTSTDPYGGDDLLFAYGSQLAMGLAVLRARHLAPPLRPLGAADAAPAARESSNLEQLAVWDGGPPRGPAGTASDNAFWKKHGLATTVIAAGAAYSPEAPTATSAQVSSPPPSMPARRLCAMLFGDVKGYSKLRESQITTFVDGVMGALAAALEPFDGALLSRTTWGDALNLVLEDAPSAARAALALQRTMRGIDLEALGLPAAMGLRIGAHAGPVFERIDPVTRLATQIGTHVTRTARIEPITPVGEVYVTEQFAAALALESDAFRCDYVGRMASAKGYGAMRMYLLRPA